MSFHAAEEPMRLGQHAALQKSVRKGGESNQPESPRSEAPPTLKWGVASVPTTGSSYMHRFHQLEMKLETSRLNIVELAPEEETEAMADFKEWWSGREARLERVKELEDMELEARDHMRRAVGVARWVLGGMDKARSIRPTLVYKSERSAEHMPQNIARQIREAKQERSRAKESLKTMEVEKEQKIVPNPAIARRGVMARDVAGASPPALPPRLGESMARQSPVRPGMGPSKEPVSLPRPELTTSPTQRVSPSSAPAEKRVQFSDEVPRGGVASPVALGQTKTARAVIPGEAGKPLNTAPETVPPPPPPPAPSSDAMGKPTTNIPSDMPILPAIQAAVAQRTANLERQSAADAKTIPSPLHKQKQPATFVDELTPTGSRAGAINIRNEIPSSSNPASNEIAAPQSKEVPGIQMPQSDAALMATTPPTDAKISDVPAKSNPGPIASPSAPASSSPASAKTNAPGVSLESSKSAERSSGPAGSSEEVTGSKEASKASANEGKQEKRSFFGHKSKNKKGKR